MIIRELSVNALQHQQILTMPEGSKFLCVREHGGHLTRCFSLWYIVPDPNTPIEVRKIVIMRTGQEYEFPMDVLTHLGTCFYGAFVMHIFELLPGYQGPGWGE